MHMFILGVCVCARLSKGVLYANYFISVHTIQYFCGVGGCVTANVCLFIYVCVPFTLFLCDREECLC